MRLFAYAIAGFILGFVLWPLSTLLFFSVLHWDVSSYNFFEGPIFLVIGTAAGIIVGIISDSKKTKSLSSEQLPTSKYHNALQALRIFIIAIIAIVVGYCVVLFVSWALIHFSLLG